MKRIIKRAIAVALPVALVIGVTSPIARAADVENITFLVDNSQVSTDGAKALADAFNKANPTINVTVTTRPGGADGDNLVKTKLATGEMEDLFWYNSGSLFQALNPSKNLLDISKESFMNNVLSSYFPVVSAGGKQYGIPLGTAMGGGILYNKKIYAKLKLSVPTTWSQFMANNKKIKAAGIDPVIQSYKDTWTSQLFVLADFYNVLASDKNWATNYTNNKAKYAATPAALAGFQHLEDVKKAGYLNRDFASTTFPQALTKLANGEGAHYPMLTFAIPTIAAIAPDKLDDIGFFAQPGTDAKNVGLTVWTPSGVYIPAATKHAAAAKKFMAFLVSPKAIDIQNGIEGWASGPYYVKNASIPNALPSATHDLLTYFQSNKTAPALEFLSPIKGPNLEKITVEVGSGITPAKKGAAAYDQDVIKQAKQLGLSGW
jgi:raffinose/stachyose/melibiose transport system substrate-binding protein